MSLDDLRGPYYGNSNTLDDQLALFGLGFQAAFDLDRIFTRFADP